MYVIVYTSIAHTMRFSSGVSQIMVTTMLNMKSLSGQQSVITLTLWESIAYANQHCAYFGIQNYKFNLFITFF